MENFELIQYDPVMESVYIFFTKPDLFSFYSEVLPENSEIILDLGKEVPVIGIEIAGELAKKLIQLPSEKKHFTKNIDSFGNDFYLLQLEEKPIKHRVSYERIIDVKFLFADDEYTDFIGIEVYSNNPYYLFVQSEGESRSRGLFKKMIDKILP